MIGEKRRFIYPSYFLTLPEYRLHSGQIGHVERQLTQEEADQGEGMERMFKVRFDDGFVGDVFESELHEISSERRGQ